MIKAPVIFVGHGSPMNAIETNEFSKTWQKLGIKLGKPKAILAVSAHWYTHGTKIMNIENPETIYDMYGFPEELYKVVYKANGATAIAQKANQLLSPISALDHSFGLDHGVWSVLRWMYPNADVPVFEMSVDMDATMQTHFELGKKLEILRQDGVMILGSGNVVHNLMAVDWELEGGFPWAEEFDSYIKENILNKKFDNVIEYQKAGSSARIAFPTPDHFAPLLYCLGASNESDKVEVFNDKCVLGALSMTGYILKDEH